MTSRGILMGAASLVILVVSCIDYREEIALNRDGSGRMTVRISIDESLMAMAEEGETPFSFAREEIEKEYEGKNVHVENVDVHTEEGKRHLVVTLGFDDINKFPRSGIFEGREISFDEEGGFLTYRSSIPSSGAIGKEEEFGKQMAKAMLSGYSLTFIVHLPFDIVEASPGGRVEGKTATWEYPLAGLMGERIEMTAKARVSGLNLWYALGIGLLALAFLSTVGWVFRRRARRRA